MLPVRTRSACKILIVEDDPSIREALVLILAHLDYEVAAVESVWEGLAMLDGQAIAILDLNLPDGLGTTILERIRTEKRPMKVAIATGSDDVALLADAERYCPDLMLRKPFSVNKLLEWLDSVG